MPAAVQRSTISPSFQWVTLRLVVRAIEIIESMGLEVTREVASRPSMPRRATVNISSRPNTADLTGLVGLLPSGRAGFCGSHDGDVVVGRGWVAVVRSF